MLFPCKSFTAVALFAIVAVSVQADAGARAVHRAPAVHRDTASESLIYSFAGGSDGAYPQARILHQPGGTLFGVTLNGGANHCGACGTVFRLTPQPGGSFTKDTVYRFRGGRDGDYPAARLWADASGNLFGSTEKGGLSDRGTIFESHPDSSSFITAVIYRFDSRAGGATPEAPLIEDKSGVLYGTTAAGSSKGMCYDDGCGTAFKLAPQGARYLETVMYRFKGGTDGGIPMAPLLSDNHGGFFGTTTIGGTSGCEGRGCGTVYELAPSGSTYVEHTLYAFAGLTDGSDPEGGVIEDKDGALYGATVGGGLSCPGAGCGIVFKLTPSDSGYQESVLYSFAGSGDGAAPTGHVVMGKQGVIYGTTTLSYGLTPCDCGVVFALTPSGSGYTEQILHAFTGAPNDGDTPYGGVAIDGTSGTLYGTTVKGGADNFGAVYRIKL
jgi:uncharacterized repeat protein (TIGR03803 family)